jgi:hypothetical protein
MDTETGLTREFYDRILSSAPENCRYAIFNKVKVAVPGKKRQATTDKMLAPSIQTLEPGQHSPRDLITRCKAASQRRGSQLSPLQVDAMKIFSDTLPHHEKVKDASETDIFIKSHLIHLKALMFNYFLVFDQLFFFGSLLGHCELVLSPDFRNWTLGECCPDLFSGKAIITIYNIRETTFEDRVQSYLCTLLHEMIHAYIQVYVQIDHISHSRGLVSHLGVGYTQHGVAWHNIAHALEQAVNDPKLLGLQLDLGRQVSLDAEIYYTEEHSGFMGVDRPGQPMDPEIWGLKRKDEGQKKRFAEHEAQIQKELQKKVQNTPGVR